MSVATEMMFAPYPDELFWQLIDKLEKALKFQGRSSITFWDCVRAYESRDWCERGLLFYFLENPVPDKLLPRLIGDDNGQFSADDTRRFDLLLDSVYAVLRQYAEFIRIGN